jgi:aldehyde dehydrogenase (NAD+)
MDLEVSIMEIADIVQKQKDFFATGITLSYSFRKQAIEKIERSLHNHESDIIEALRLDLGKSPFESYLSEIGMVYDELHYVKKHLRKWMKKEKVKTYFS